MKEYNWACIGCGHIAGEMAEAFSQLGRSFSAVYSRTYANAEAFAKQHSVKKVYKSADELFADKSIDIVYIATPHNRHLEYILKAAQSGKHILCEKAITLNSGELETAIAECNKHGVILAEAMTIYHMPVYRQVREYMESGGLGALRLIEVNLGSNKEYDMSSRFFSPELAGGAMLDIGVYALSFVRSFMSENADLVKSTVKLAPTGVDEQAVMLLSNSKDEMASVTLSLTARLPRNAAASFDNGYVEFKNYNRSTEAQITFLDGKEPILLTSDPNTSPLCYEIEDMEKSLEGGDLTSLTLTRDVMSIMTQARNDWGVVYPEEK